MEGRETVENGEKVDGGGYGISNGRGVEGRKMGERKYTEKKIESSG